MNFKVKDYFLSYVKYDTQSDDSSDSFPSTAKQLKLLNKLAEDLKSAGIKDATIDEFGYVVGTIPANTNKKVPTIAFFAHVDTASEVTGENVKPQIVENYQGEDIKLIDDENQVIKIEENTYLKGLVGHDVITTDGTTLLGADDKSGVAIIMDAARILIENDSIKHGEIKVVFNPDEEIGRGMDHIDIKKIGANFGYTLDGSDRGEIEYENFHAYGATVTFQGKAIHPGYANNKMINAAKVASYFMTLLPDKFSPEHTEGYEGFVHPITLEANNEDAEVKFIIRDFEFKNIKKFEKLISEKAKEAAKKFGARVQIDFVEQYRNMREIIEKDMRVVEYAKTALENLNIKPIVKPIRGGTDGARLTYMGLPCPNIFTGQQNYHGKQEYISVQDMEDSVKTVIEICKVWVTKTM